MKKFLSNATRRFSKWIVGIFFLSIMYLIIIGFSQLDSTNPISTENYNIDTLIIDSKVLNEKREIKIFKLQEFTKEDSVLFLYLLDGEFSEFYYNDVLKEQFDTPVIGIGIVNTNRRRDMLPNKQPDKFLEFISNELIPEIETGYKTNQRILFGHSNAGGFTIYTMIKAPSLFDKYIASSPTPFTNLNDTVVYKQLDNRLNSEIKLYFSYGSKDKKRVKKWSEKLYNNLQKVKLNNLEWKNEIYEGENHNTCSSISLIKGLYY
jgi:predicted alpha/beta superfamily hydrolase